MVSEDKPEFSNTYCPTDTTLAGIVAEAIFVLANALSPITVSLFVIFTVEIPVFSNALAPIAVTLSGKVIVFALTAL